MIVGAGIVGLATAFRLLEARPDLDVRVLERAETVGTAQSSHNSGVLHAGLYYTPGSARAVLCRRGKAAYEAFARDHDVPVERTGKLVVAVRRAEIPRLRALVDRARTNGVEITELGADELRDREPHVTGVAGAWTPETAVTDFGVACTRLAVLIEARGGVISTGVEVQRLDERDDHVRIETSTGELEATTVVTCAGLFADRLAAASGLAFDERILPFRGSWLRLRHSAGIDIRGNIYPVPLPGLPFLGVHLTRRVNGEVWIGPNAVLAGARDGRGPWSVAATDLLDTLRFKGTWALAGRNAATAIREVALDRMLRAAVRKIQEYVPEIGVDDVERGPWGVRAQLVEPDGTLADDFVIRETARVVHLLNAPSPAATASLVIGEELRDRVLARAQSSD
ncbi:MAG: L-2-hydroxyglutarate oxidase [Nitriliruptoraceae bacterium]